jgi:hypothetical protein
LFSSGFQNKIWPSNETTTSSQHNPQSKSLVQNVKQAPQANPRKNTRKEMVGGRWWWGRACCHGQQRDEIVEKLIIEPLMTKSRWPILG